MLLHPKVFTVDSETVTPEFIGMPETATNELQTLGVEFFSGRDRLDRGHSKSIS
jgi:hypothetical protein